MMSYSQMSQSLTLMPTKHVQRGEPKGVLKHALGVHVWAGISRRGATQNHIFTARMDSVYYQSIVEKRLVPFVRTKFPDGHRYMQDNDPKHVSKSTLQFIRDNGINYLPTPPETPDMIPIECIWANLKHHIRMYVEPHNRAELIDGINKFGLQ